MVGVLLAILITMVTIQRTDKPIGGDKPWKEQLSQQADEMERTLNNPEMQLDDDFRQSLERRVAEYRYAINHDYDITKKNLWKTVLDSSNMVVLVTIFTVVVAGDIVAGEFSGGTIKMLLIRPVKRGRILLSKYAATLLYAVFMLGILFVFAVIVGSVAYGWGGSSVPHLVVGSDLTVHESSMLVHALKTYGYECVSLIMMVTFAFMISSAFRSSSMSIGLSLGLLFMGNLVVQLLRKYDWIKYFLFANTDLRQHLDGRPIVSGMTLEFSLVVLLVYFVIFNAVSWLLFTKRDVAA